MYGTEHTFRVADVQIKHNVGAQKEHGYRRHQPVSVTYPPPSHPLGLSLPCRYTRYEVDKGAQLRLDGELRIGHAQIDQWLKKNSLPRLPLPNVCGYVPLARHLTKALRRPGAPTLAPISAAYRSDAVKKAETEGADADKDVDSSAAAHEPKTAPISEDSLKRSLGWARRW